MNGHRVPQAKGDHVLAGVKAKPSGRPPASPDTGSGRGPSATSGTGGAMKDNRSHKIRSLRSQGIAGCCRWPSVRSFRVEAAADVPAEAFAPAVLRV